MCACARVRGRGRSGRCGRCRSRQQAAGSSLRCGGPCVARRFACGEFGLRHECACAVCRAPNGECQCAVPRELGDVQPVRSRKRGVETVRSLLAVGGRLKAGRRRSGAVRRGAALRWRTRNRAETGYGVRGAGAQSVRYGPLDWVLCDWVSGTGACCTGRWASGCAVRWVPSRTLGELGTVGCDGCRTENVIVCDMQSATLNGGGRAQDLAQLTARRATTVREGSGRSERRAAVGPARV